MPKTKQTAKNKKVCDAVKGGDLSPEGSIPVTCHFWLDRTGLAGS